MRNKFNEALISAMLRDDQMIGGTFGNKFIEVEHQDGSKYHVTHSKMENTMVYDLPCIILFANHNSPQIFVEYDLKKVVLQPFKGKKVVYKLAKDPNDIKPAKKVKRAVKKVVKKQSIKEYMKENPPFSGPYPKATKKAKSKKK
jgi:hypothetical protein